MGTTTGFSNDVTRIKNKYLAVTADKTLLPAESGLTFLLDAVGEAITLPLPAAGLNYKFMCTVTTGTTDWTIVTSAAAKILSGSAQVAGAVVAASLETTVTLVVAKFLPGDWVTLESDGTSWFVEGSVVTAAGCTFTGA